MPYLDDFNEYRGLNKGGAGGAIAPPPYFGRIEGAAGQRRQAASLLNKYETALNFIQLN